MCNNAIQNLLFEKEIIQPPMGNVQNHSLQSFVMMGSICGTITVTGHRTRKTCGFFVSQIPFKGLLHPENIEFAVRLISRDKAEYIRTNKASRVTAVVETVSHLLAIYPFNHLLKTVTAMKNPIQNPTALLAAYFPIVSTSTQGGLANA